MIRLSRDSFFRNGAIKRSYGEYVKYYQSFGGDAVDVGRDGGCFSSVKTEQKSIDLFRMGGINKDNTDCYCSSRQSRRLSTGGDR